VQQVSAIDVPKNQYKDKVIVFNKIKVSARPREDEGGLSAVQVLSISVQILTG
jgi:hypothetical protein